ncbi:P-loop containing nucleoside triphosphate hydrolase [Pseudocohnilembus persalinus]|uniref:p-loop containing nucleoside triphosphate hydrolase n=1 Tax=Pseudocohnilembus persalinus TaxID=266149 RepID=A0A0V0R503_PSEPJ|nr:P-loop containing nucleoside triphosphate hydrolase [Pseudocohnilembus persalinus]|eukprot:KRX09559.1 P-loop containing nucleoside triphosphate hydrolase [Pseudocohnilembus persalinus]
MGYIVGIDINSKGEVHIYLKLDENYRKIRNIIKQILAETSWIKSLKITIASQDSEKKSQFKGGLERVKKIIAVSSCKGGVGKSTIAINLACMLQKQGKKVGIYDADIYGPSLPTLIKKEDSRLYSPESDSTAILPIEYEGMKAMSYGFASTDKAMIRGPQVTGIVKQLLTKTQWGDLDYLVVDFPPGTGDIQLTLCQEVKFDGAVIVTTPQKLSFMDVVKGIKMFDVLQVPTIAIVENMSEYVCDQCDKHHKFFGQGHLAQIKNQFGIERSLQLPLFNYLALCSDAGQPAVHILPEKHTVYNKFKNLSDMVVQELIAISKNPKYDIGTVMEGNKQIIVVKQGNEIMKKIDAWELRRSCQCASCVDEFTGKKIIKDNEIEKDVQAFEIQQTGNYAVTVQWSDGHNTSIYPYKTMLSDQIDSAN